MSDLPQYVPNDDADEPTRLSGLIEFLSAYIEQYHGGWVKLHKFDGKTVTVEMGGACLGCPLSPTTLHGWIEGTVKQFFPDIEQVVEISAE